MSFGILVCACSLGAALVGLSGCSQEQPAESPHAGQSFAAAMQMICSVDQRIGLSAEENPISIEMARHDWFMTHIKNPDGIELVTLLRVRSNKEKAEMLHSAIEKTPLKTCKLATGLELE